MFCTQCGARNPQQARFCEACGNPLVDVTVPPAPAVAPSSAAVAPQADPSTSPDAGGTGKADAQYRIRGTPEDVAQVIAGYIATVFSSAEFSTLFSGHALADGWTVGDALAVWYSLGHLSLDVAAWRAYNDAAKVARVLDYCRPRLVREWDMSEEVYNKLRAAVNEKDAEAFKAFVVCTGPADLRHFFVRYISWILGAPLPLSNRDIFEDQLGGLLVLGCDPILTLAVSDMFVKASDAVQEILAQYSFVWEPAASPPPKSPGAEGAQQ